MQKAFFQSIEASPKDSRFPLDTIIDHLTFNEKGLIPVITQKHDTGKVLMMAWMNVEAIRKTLATGDMTYWSRSRQSFWIKGETSGNTQRLKKMQIDCDGDALLCLVDQKGASCHTNRSNCFYFDVDIASSSVIVQEPLIKS